MMELDPHLRFSSTFDQSTIGSDYCLSVIKSAVESTDSTSTGGGGTLIISNVNKSPNMIPDLIAQQNPKSSTYSSTNPEYNSEPNQPQSPVLYIPNAQTDFPGPSHKKRDWSKVMRKFHDEWTEMYAVGQRANDSDQNHNHRPFCLICQKVLSQMKVHSIRQHYRKLHSDFEQRFPFGSAERTVEIGRLSSILSQQLDSSFDHFGSSGSTAVPGRDLDDEDEEDDDEEEEEEDEDSDQEDLDDLDVHHQSAQILDSNSLDLPGNFLETSFSEPNTSADSRPFENLTPPLLLNSSSSDAAKKRRDWTKVVRKFHHQWTEQYLVVESVQHQKPLCLICQKVISAMKVHNIKRHFSQLHSNYFDHHYPPGSASRKAELCRLLDAFRRHQHLNQTFVSILSTPDLCDLDDEPGPGPDDHEARNDDEFEVDLIQQPPPQPPPAAPEMNGYHQDYSLQPNHPLKRNSPGLSLDKLERAFTHLDQFLAIIEQDDPNHRRSQRVRTAVEVVVDCYKRQLKQLKLRAE